MTTAGDHDPRAPAGSSRAHVVKRSGSQDAPAAHTRRLAAGVLLFFCFLLVLLITLYPVAPDLRILAPLAEVLGSLGVAEPYRILGAEIILNMLMFVPLGLLLVVLLPDIRFWWVAVIATATVSFGVELVQGVALAARSATLYDFAANTAGGAAGVATGVLWVRRRNRRAPAPAQEQGHRGDAGADP